MIKWLIVMVGLILSVVVAHRQDSVRVLWGDPMVEIGNMPFMNCLPNLMKAFV